MLNQEIIAGTVQAEKDRQVQSQIKEVIQNV